MISVKNKINNLKIYRNFITSQKSFDKGKSAKGLRHFKRAFQLSHGSNIRYNNLGVGYFGIGKYRLALRCQLKAADVKPDSKIYRNLGDDECGLNNYRESIHYYKKAIALNPKDSVAYENLGKAELHLGNYQKAVRCDKEAVALSPKDGVLYNNLGASYSYIGAFRLAIKFAKKSIHLGYREPVAYLNLALYEGIINNYSKALHFAKIAVKNESFPSGNSCRILGIIYAELSLADPAVKYLKKGMSTVSVNSKDYYVLSISQFCMGDMHSSIHSMERAVEMNPDNSHYYAELARICFYDNKKTWSLHLIDRAIDLGLDDVNDYDTASYIFEGTGNCTIAKRYAQDAEELRNK